MELITHFEPTLFDFLVDLADNNEREWFISNKARYEAEVKQPCLGFITAFAPHLQSISPHFVAIPRAVGGSLFRIHRDTRFSKDKRPYKTHAGMHFRHVASSRDVHAPGYYLHLEPGGVFGGVGIWHPERRSLTAIRAAIDADPDAWRSALHATGIPERLQLEGESLKRAPRGYPADHPLIEDIKRKDFIVSFPLTEADVLRPGFVEEFADACRSASPLMAFLCQAVGVAF